MNNNQSIYRNSEGGYIFISHSHLDIDKVRIIRNTLEQEGFEPLCFYLKCLTDDDEVEGLIKREIDSRDIFLYIESKNSLDSKWVKKERQYINKCSNKTVYTINIDDPNVDVKKETLKILQRSRVFLSYSHLDEPIFKQIKESLVEKDLKVYNDLDIPIGEDWVKQTQIAIQNACRDGCFVLIITKNSLSSSMVKIELNSAYKILTYENGKGGILPVIIGDIDVKKEHPGIDYFFKNYLSDTAYLQIHEEPTKEDIESIVNSIKSILRKKKID